MAPAGRRHRSHRPSPTYGELRAEIRRLKGLVAGLFDEFSPEDQADLARHGQLCEAHAIWRQWRERTERAGEVS
jgi:hypothetical protein